MRKLLIDIFHSWNALRMMRAYARSRTYELNDCSRYRMMPSKELMRKYNIRPDDGEIWALLEENFNRLEQENTKTDP